MCLFADFDLYDMKLPIVPNIGISLEVFE